MMIRKILLLPVVERIEHAAIQRAAGLALAAKAPVELLKVVYEPHLEGYLGNKAVYGALRKRLVDESAQRQEALAQFLRDQGVNTQAKAVWGHPWHEAVASEVLAGGADLVIAAPSEASGALSHEDLKLAMTCPVPLLVVAGGGVNSYEHVLAAVDPYDEHGKQTDLDLAILEAAEELCALSGAELKVLHCFTPLSEFIDRGLEHVPVGDAESALEKARGDALAGLLTRAGLSGDSGELAAGRPEAVLLSRAESGEADLLVLGNASSSVWREFFIGSTAERVLRRTKADTLIVKPPGFRVTVSMQSSNV